MRSSLELLLLSLIRDGLGTPYELKAQADISLGSTVPALARLGKAGLIKATKTPESRSTQRFTLTPEGARTLKTQWREQLKSDVNDVESVLRIAYLALLNQESKGCAEFLERCSRNLEGMATMAKAEVHRFTPRPSGADSGTLRWLRARLALCRLESELEELRSLAGDVRKLDATKPENNNKKNIAKTRKP